MRTYKDIMQELETTRKEAAKARELIRHTNKRQNEEFFNKLATTYNYLNLKSMALENNSHCAFANEYKKPMMEILNKYAGKKLGPKTLEKLQKEFKEKLGMSICFRQYYYNSLFVNTYDDEGYLRYCNEKELFSTGIYQNNELSKVEDITAKQKYIEDIEAYILKLVNMQGKLEQLSQELYNLTRDYNSIKFEGMKEAAYNREYYHGYFREWI